MVTTGSSVGWNETPKDRACAGGAIPEAPHSGATDMTWKEASFSSQHTVHTA